MRIGIVGSGIAGLTAAWELRRAGASVTVFEKQSSLGMDTHSISFELNESTVRADVPSRMFNKDLWPRLSRMYQDIGVETCSVDPSKSFSNHDQPALFRIGKSFVPDSAASLLLKPSARQIFKDIARMVIAAPKYLATAGGKNSLTPDQTMREYLASNKYSQAFIYEFLYPALSSTVCTCSYSSLDAYPAETLLSSMLNLISPNSLQRTRHGTQDVVNRLLGFDEKSNKVSHLPIDVRLGMAVQSARQSADSVALQTDCGKSFEFDHLVVATQANAAIRIVDDLSAIEEKALASFRYENVSVMVHTDESLMPVQKKDWSTFNMISDTTNSSAMCSIWLNQFYPEWRLENRRDQSPVFQTIMPLREAREESLICQTKMQRPVVDKVSLSGIGLLNEARCQPNRRVWFCGSYASPGIPLLESGVTSSQNVVAQITTRQKTTAKSTSV